MSSHPVVPFLADDLASLPVPALVDALVSAAKWWDATEWALGDLVVEAMRRARDGHPLPEEVWHRLHQASAARAATVAVAFPRARRRPLLTWGHHEQVAKLTEAHQDRLLDLAEAEGLTVRALRAVMRQEAEDLRPELGGMPVRGWKPAPALARRVGELLAAHPEAAPDLDAAVHGVLARWST